jgi:regulator of sigma E protease
MLGALGGILAFVFIFGMVVFVHELGHFLAAKAAGVYAPRFSIGFGSPIWRRKWGETEYVLATFPLGGYVRMASKEDESLAGLEGGKELGAVPTNRLFESKPLLARLFILTAGVAMNVVLGFIVFSLVAYSLGAPVTRTRVVADVDRLPSAPQLAQLQAGDSILAIDGHAVRNWNDIDAALDTGTANIVRIRTQRTEFSVPVGDSGQPTREQLAAAIAPKLPPVFGGVSPGKPADRAGIKTGDSVVAVNGQPVSSWRDIVRRIEQSPGTRVDLVIARGGSRQSIAVVPESTARANPITGEQEVVGKIQAGARLIDGYEPITALQSVKAGWRTTWAFAIGIVDTLKRLLAGKESVKNLQGPIGIFGASNQAAQTGFVSVLWLLGIISVNVAVFNLLPLPILDGGQIALNVLEAVRGSSFSLRTRETLARVGIAAIALLFLIVTYNDVIRVYGAVVNWVQAHLGG